MNRRTRSGFFQRSLALGILAALPALAPADEAPRKFPPNSPEHQALTASSPYLANEEFTLRNDYWKGVVTPKAGTAMRLQFFKGNTYRLFFGAAKDELPAGARLHLHIFDSKNKEVTSAAGEPSESAVVLNHKNRKTGLYLILMRIEQAPDSGNPPDGEEGNIASVLFYGWE